MLLVPYTHNPGGKDTAHHAGPHRGCTLEQNDEQSLWGQAFYCEKSDVVISGVFPCVLTSCWASWGILGIRIS